MKTRLAIAVLAVTPLVAAACGSSTQSAVENVPPLGAHLQRVDEALANEQYRKARLEVRKLIDLASNAESDGSLDEAQSQEILAAASRLRAALPSKTPTPSPSVTVTVTPDPEGEQSDEKGKPGGSEENSQGKPDPKGKAKGHDKQDE